MTKKPSPVFSPSRRATLKTASLALCAGLLPLAPIWSRAAAQAATQGARYRRYKVSDSRMGARMLASYARAVRAMLALPPEDPRNWYRQALVHTLDCPHGNWWFLPWHRGYLGWFEQVCRELSGDSEFALPYWDWTTEPRVPAGMFQDVLDPNNGAYIATGPDFERRLRNALADCDYWTTSGGVFEVRSRYAQLLQRHIRFGDDLFFDATANPAGRMFFDQPAARGLRREHPDFNAVATAAVSLDTLHAALAAPDFTTFGSAKTVGHSLMAGFGILEANPHNNVHRCVGSVDCNYVDAQGFMTDMLSPVDPLFFLHHANIDRLWDVWTRKQLRLGLPTLPDGAALATALPDEQKSAAETNTDYYRWASEPALFFVDRQGKPVAATRMGDYESMAAFEYDYEPGAGEDVVARAARPAARRVASGKVLDRMVRSAQPASATVQLPSGMTTGMAAAMVTAGAAGTTAGTTLVANITLNFPQMSHRAFAVVLNGPDDASQVDPASPFYLATLSMFGHHGACGALTYAVPLGAKLDAANKVQAASKDGALKLRILPLPAAGGMAGMEEIGAVELLAVSVEAY